MTTAPTASTYQFFVSVSSAAASFVATWTNAGRARERARRFLQTPEGYTAFQEALTAIGGIPAAALVVLKATGSYWIMLAVMLHQADYTLSVVNPIHAHVFARSLPRRAKTDVLDTQVLAQFAAECQPARWTPPEQVYHELHQCLLVCDSLLTMHQQVRNQRHALRQWPVHIAALDQIDVVIANLQIDVVIANLDTRITTLKDELATVLRDGAWAKSADLLGIITGIGLVTTAWILVATLNFQACRSADGATAYARLVPLAHESGTSLQSGPRLDTAAIARLRPALYVAALTTARFSPVIRAQYGRLRAAGKAPKVARCTQVAVSGLRRHDQEAAVRPVLSQCAACALGARRVRDDTGRPTLGRAVHNPWAMP